MLKRRSFSEDNMENQRDQNDNSSLAGLRVLVVDDHEATHYYLSHILTHYGAVVKTAASAAEALSLIPLCRPMVIISDICMPGMDGYALIAHIRSLPADKGGQIPAIALTSLNAAAERQRALEAGFQRHVAKPAYPDELVIIIRQLVMSS